MATNLLDWYWSGTPGIWGSARKGFVSQPADDTAYKSWLALNFRPAFWPKDDTGAETTEALDVVLSASGLPPTGLRPLTKAQMQSYANAKATALLAAPHANVLARAPSANGDAIAAGVIAHTKAVYAILASAMTGIAGATITTTAQIDALSWPV